MKDVVRSLIDSEDQSRSGMRWDDIMRQLSSGGAQAKKAIEDLIDLKYVVRIIEGGKEETKGDLRIKMLTEVYGTTFFGRKWLAELEKADQKSGSEPSSGKGTALF
jgi:hypothetical protein